MINSLWRWRYNRVIGMAPIKLLELSGVGSITNDLMLCDARSSDIASMTNKQVRCCPQLHVKFYLFFQRFLQELELKLGFGSERSNPGLGELEEAHFG